VVETAKSAIGARNEQELVEAIKDDPEAAKSVKAAVQAVWYELQEMGGGVEAARKANAELTDKAAHKNPALWVTAAILPLVYLVVSAVLFREGWTDEIKMMVVTAILTGVLGGVTGYWLGTSSSSARKTELAQK
jgi:C4-dicarboxylate transporter